MMYLRVYVCLIISVLLIDKGSADDNSLKLVQMMFRHGDRAPIALYKNDPNKDPSLWPEGLGQLTKKGKEMQYKLGKWIRNRYEQFISKKWIPDEVYVKSTDMDRTLMSAACALAGFYYPDVPDRFIPEIPWLPIPIYSVPEEMDKLLRVGKNCPVFQENSQPKEDPSFVKEVKEENDELFNILANKTGENVTLEYITRLFDTLFIEKIHNLTIPDWVDEFYPQLEKLSNFNNELYCLSEEKKRILGGPIIKELNQHMKDKVEGKINTKMYIYSGHDSTVNPLLSGLRVFNNVTPPYAATVIIELHKIEDNHYVKLFLRNDTEFLDPPYALTIPGCKVTCPLEEWLELTSKVIPEDWDEECSIAAYDFSVNAATVLALVFAILFLLLFVGLLTYIVMDRRQGSEVHFHAISMNEM